MENKIKLFIIFCFAIFFSVSGFSEDLSGKINSGKQFIEKFDMDNDGLVSVDEFKGPVFFFNRLDENRDGFIEESEQPAGPPPFSDEIKQHFKDLDENLDGLVSVEEFDGSASMFNRLDKNQDDFIEESELPMGPHPHAGPGNKKEHFEKMDTDQDGRISIEEFDGPDGHFNYFDRDENGYLDESEMPDIPPQPARDNAYNNEN